MAACTAAMAADVYRWVDDHGVTNVSDVVPEQYKKVAQKVDIALEPARRDAAPVPSSIVASPATSAPRGVGASASAIRPARAASAGSLSGADDYADCAMLQRRYKESQDCFGPQPRTITGAINGARAPQCPVVVDPSPRCGLPNGGEGPPATGP